jgi:hypothetical protein
LKPIFKEFRLLYEIWSEFGMPENGAMSIVLREPWCREMTTATPPAGNLFSEIQPCGLKLGDKLAESP